MDGDYVQSVGILGTMLGGQREEHFLMKHRLILYLTGVSIAMLLTIVVRSQIPFIAKRYPLRVKWTKGDILQLIVIMAVVCPMYIQCVYGGIFPRYRDDFLAAHRVSVLFGLHLLYTAAYYFCIKFVVCNLEPAQQPPQAANIIRITVKLSVFAYWCLSGEFFTLVQTHPLELTNEKFFSAHIVMIAINSLYLWEMLFRDLRPVHIVHHYSACLGSTAFIEVHSVLDPTRVNVAMPMLGSLIEGFCCVGSIAYRYMRRGPALSRILMGITIFILISYNLLLVGYVMVLYGYHHLYDFAYGCIAMPFLAISTYPAQMNMMRMFYTLSKKARGPQVPKPPVVEVAVEERRTALVSRERMNHTYRG